MLLYRDKGKEGRGRFWMGKQQNNRFSDKIYTYCLNIRRLNNFLNLGVAGCQELPIMRLH
ncbi:hypothetical protein CYR52_21135 [Chimaeribacter arupi]|nr:hypothetical protein CYR52_21135 [Chimaeribacter arupi]